MRVANLKSIPIRVQSSPGFAVLQPSAGHIKAKLRTSVIEATDSHRPGGPGHRADHEREINDSRYVQNAVEWLNSIRIDCRKYHGKDERHGRFADFVDFLVARRTSEKAERNDRI